MITYGKVPAANAGRVMADSLGGILYFVSVGRLTFIWERPSVKKAGA